MAVASLHAQSPGYFGAEAGSPVTPPMTSAPSELAVARTHYEQEVKQATAPIRVHYAQTLDALKKTLGAKGDVAAALAVQQEIDHLGVAQNSLFTHPKEARVTIWNQHNAEHKNCGAKTINLALIADGKEVWRQDNIKIPWLPTEDTKVEVPVPYVPTDKVRVEVTEYVDRGGGLAEIEYWWDGRNYARKRPVTVSAVWGNSPKCNGATLTDGITTSKDGSVGYWALPDLTTGWAEVSLSVGD